MPAKKPFKVGDWVKVSSRANKDPQRHLDCTSRRYPGNRGV